MHSLGSYHFLQGGGRLSMIGGGQYFPTCEDIFALPLPTCRNIWPTLGPKKKLWPPFWTLQKSIHYTPDPLKYINLELFIFVLELKQDLLQEKN